MTGVIPMRKHASKVAVIGAGLVGSSTAFSLLTQGLCDEILLVDKKAERAHGEMMDLRDCIDYLGRNVRVTDGGYADCGDADIVVITAGPPPREGQTRLDTLDLSMQIIRSIVGPVMEVGFSGIFLIISNPVDIIAQSVWKLSGLPKSQVIGTGTALDSARLKALIGGLIGIDPRSVHAYALGEHGDSQMVPWSRVTVGGKPFSRVLRDNPGRFEGVDLDRLVHDTVQAGWEILKRKGTTYYGIATTAAGIIKCILQDENRIIPVSTLLEGEYGERGVFCGVPAIIGRGGVQEIVQLPLTDGEAAKFHASCEVLRGFVKDF